MLVLLLSTKIVNLSQSCNEDSLKIFKGNSETVYIFEEPVSVLHALILI